MDAAPFKGTMGNQSEEIYTFLEAVNVMLFSKIAEFCRNLLCKLASLGHLLSENFYYYA